MNSAKRVLPADVYDALELSAWVHGGIGAGSWVDDAGQPLCATGHRWFLDGDERIAEISNAFYYAGIQSATNDPAVQAINKRHGAPLNDRVPFDKWCEEMNVVRGA